MMFVETPIFTDGIQKAMTDESYRDLQSLLIQRPDAGAIIAGSGGLRKMRWRSQQTGKRGGVRIIYYWVVDHSVIYMLSIYHKAQQADLKPQQIKMLRQLVEDYLNG